MTNIQIRSTNCNWFRSGQWASLEGLRYLVPAGRDTARLCFVVEFPEDGYVDEWPVYSGNAEYEFRQRPAPSLLSQGMTIVYSQSTVTYAKAHLQDTCGFVQMPWNPDAVRWCTERKLHGHDHNSDGGPAPWVTPKLS